MVRALKLTHIYTDSIYKAYDLQVFNDTIVGHFVDSVFDPGFYFIQPLKNPAALKIIKRNIIELKNEASCSSCTTPVEQLKNGCLYFPRYGSSTIVKLCDDSTAVQYLSEFKNKVFYSNRLLFLKDTVVISSFNGIYVFNLTTEKLLWEQQYKNGSLNNGSIGLVGKKLIYTWEIEPAQGQIVTYITCIDLQNFTKKWQKALPNDFIDNGQQNNFLNRSIEADQRQRICISTRQQFQVIDVNTGSILFALKNDALESRLPSYFLENNRLYLTYFDKVCCFDLAGKNTVWKTPNCALLGLYKDYLICVSEDNRFFKIIDKNTGNVLNSIANPDILSDNSIRFIGKYLLINNNALYR